MEALAPDAEPERIDEFFRYGMWLNVAAAMGVEDLSVGCEWVRAEQQDAEQQDALEQPGRPVRSVRDLALGVARQAVVGNRQPRRGVGDELMRARAHAGILVERAEADADALRVPVAPAEQGRAAVRRRSTSQRRPAAPTSATGPRRS